MSHLRPTCIHNPASGHEATLRQKIEPASRKRRVVIVGAGPAGLEAARVSAERGHRVSLLEAAPKAGGQVLLAARAHWRGDLIGIVDWRLHELEKLGVEIQFNTYADNDHVLSLDPDLVVIATGGTPNIGWLPGSEYITSTWDILDGTVKPADDVLIVDGTGRHSALSAADACHKQGATIRMVTIDETLAADQTYAERVIWRKWVREINLPVRTEEQLVRVEKDGNALTATFRSELTNAECQLSAAQIVFDYGTIPADELYGGLRSISSNDGVTNLENWVAGRGVGEAQSQPPTGSFELHRIGDAVSSRNIHAAVNDALRLCQSC